MCDAVIISYQFFGIKKLLFKNYRKLETKMFLSFFFKFSCTFNIRKLSVIKHNKHNALLCFVTQFFPFFKKWEMNDYFNFSMNIEYWCVIVDHVFSNAWAEQWPIVALLRKKIRLQNINCGSLDSTIRQ